MFHGKIKSKCQGYSFTKTRNKNEENREQQFAQNLSATLETENCIFNYKTLSLQRDKIWFSWEAPTIWTQMFPATLFSRPRCLALFHGHQFVLKKSGRLNEWIGNKLMVCKVFLKTMQMFSEGSKNYLSKIARKLKIFICEIWMKNTRIFRLRDWEIDTGDWLRYLFWADWGGKLINDNVLKTA